MKTKLLAILAILLFVGALFWIVPILKNRYFNNQAEKNGATENIPNNQPGQITEEAQELINTNNSSPTPNIPKPKKTDPQKKETAEEILKNESNDLIEITKKDCTGNCENFKDDKINLKYCQERCGLNTSISSSANCSGLKDLEKDYCLKDLAIKNNNLEGCIEIQDDGIKKTCQNRIAEDLLDKQK